MPARDNLSGVAAPEAPQAQILKVCIGYKQTKKPRLESVIRARGLSRPRGVILAGRKQREPAVLPCSRTDVTRVFVSGVPDLGCGSPPQVKHSDIQFSSTTTGSVAAYVCHPGFIAVQGATKSICGIQGDWSQPAVCEGL